jgi:hypothetical protein
MLKHSVHFILMVVLCLEMLAGASAAEFGKARLGLHGPEFRVCEKGGNKSKAANCYFNIFECRPESHHCKPETVCRPKCKSCRPEPRLCQPDCVCSYKSCRPEPRYCHPERVCCNPEPRCRECVPHTKGTTTFNSAKAWNSKSR